ncbi:PDR/VanB family oxidoreductase (plasmid) [Arthrobacter sp. YA7-1]|uniref:PDR/VanB family oxidoreductase n=1 Tax=Arthrobacter sp. YA7-1 TaxID=2987701 RepID=UPI0022278CD5|nr:PDR/VanB family oxidoreductase [Arthrobacter sp. YA7-1]UYY83626.1 PDR/VanB family oxidoreductase [Arthrobacter sp. YA7-1]
MTTLHRPRNTLTARVHAISAASENAVLIELRPPAPTRRWWAKGPAAEAGLPAAQAGAHIDLHLGGYIRQYSLCNPPGETHRYLICVQAAPEGRGGSTHIHNTLQAGDNVQISTPRNHFPLEPAPKTLLLAGGIGVTPLLAMAETLSSQGQDFELHCFASSAERMVLADYIKTRPAAEFTTFHLPHPERTARAAIPDVITGHPAGTRFYICGPDGFIDTTRKHAATTGIDPQRLHSERFTPEPNPLPGPPGQTFAVRLSSTGKLYPVPGGKTIAETLLEHGVPIELSCNQGLCGTCLTPVLAGTPDHRDDFQTPAEKASNTSIALCCSRASTPEITLRL